MNTAELLEQVRVGYGSLAVSDSFKQTAITNIQSWLTDPQFSEYRDQLVHLISSGHWDYLLDSFYQVIPFGTGGRRGEVGIGPNRINQWTIKSSAQGHSQYLLKVHGESAKKRGVVLTYDVRQFYGNKYFNSSIHNPVMNLTGKTLQQAAAEVYAANGIRVYVFDSYRTTPELSFAIRHLNAVAGDMFSASHNPPDHNGKKVYDEFGGQLIPPFDEQLVSEVTQQVTKILHMQYEDAQRQGLVVAVGEEVDNAYIEACAQLSLSDQRDIKIAFTPLHGCGSTSVTKVLGKVGFTVSEDPETSNPSGKFEHVTFNIPNPEVIQSFDTPLKFADSISADILLNSDPDADRIGIMVRDQGEWKFMNGNEIAAVLTRFVIEKRKPTLKGKGVVIKTDVTTNLLTSICEKNDVEIIGNLLVGFKYVGEQMNILEKAGRIDNFLMGCEESHGYIAGNYLRDKDAVVAALWLAELAAELKSEHKTLINYLIDTYAQYGYFKNYLTEIRMPGAEGMAQIQKIQSALKELKSTTIGEFQIISKEDWADRLPILSETDKVSKSGIVFRFTPEGGTTSIRITIRPSGTEPKIKMYFEIGSEPFPVQEFDRIAAEMSTLQVKLERAFMKHCYAVLGIDFPERGFLLFWQLPLKDKLHYFEIEDQIVALAAESDTTTKNEKLAKLLEFLGSNPTQKVNDAFRELHQKTIEEFLQI